MTFLIHNPRAGAVATTVEIAVFATLVAMSPAQAQSGLRLPYVQNGYVGVNLGKPNFDLGCGAGGFNCDDPDVGGKIYLGGSLNTWASVEAAYLHMGRADRAGGRTTAQGLNLSLVGRYPINAFSIFGKIGATYSATKVTSDGLSGVDDGKRRGFAPSYGFGVGYDLRPNSTVVLEWERHGMRFRGASTEDIDLLSVGYVYRF